MARGGRETVLAKWPSLGRRPLPIVPHQLLHVLLLSLLHLLLLGQAAPGLGL